MTHHPSHQRFRLGTALAAALTLGSTPVFAQNAGSAQPVPTEPVTNAPAPVPDSPDVTTTTTTTTNNSATDSAAAPATPSTARSTSAPRRATHVAAAKPAPVVTHTVTRIATTHSAALASAAAPSAPAPAAPQ